jgi:hypothetical protein
MTSPQAEPSLQTLSETLAHLAVQVTALHGQISRITSRLDRAGLRDGLNLTGQAQHLAQLTQTVSDALATAAPRGPAAPSWTGLDQDTYTRQLAGLRQWIDTVLRPHYGGYQLRDCWASHPHAIWELSTLAAEWRRTYDGEHPSLDRALEFHDRWLPGTMRRVADITSACVAQCATRRQTWQPKPPPSPRPRIP